MCLPRGPVQLVKAHARETDKNCELRKSFIRSKKFTEHSLKCTAFMISFCSLYLEYVVAFFLDQC